MGDESNDGYFDPAAQPVVDPNAEAGVQVAAVEEQAPQPVADEVEVEVTTSESAPAEEQAPATVVQRADRTDLESDIRKVLDDYVTGALTLDADKKMTPHTIAKAIGVNRGEGQPVPSSGAVSAALDRWVEVGYITVSANPLAFDDYTDAGRTKGLAALKQEHRQRRAAARAAAKAESAPAAPAAEEVVGVSTTVDAAPVEEQANGEAAPF